MNVLTGQSLGRYHILEPLGEGGMAVVYKAFDTHLEHEVAVKVIRTEQISPAALSRALNRFEREAKAVAKLDHPNIVKVMDYGDHEGSPYLVMPYLPGGTLKQYLKEHGRMAWKDAAHLLIPIAEALDYAHEQKLIHRDVKPSNILLTAKGRPMLTDFGVAKIIDDEMTQDLTGTSATVGTPEYMAPEQVVSKTVDHRADIYALGVVYYEMVTGRRPYEADTPMAVLFKHASAPLPRPKDLAPDLPDEVEQVLLKALAKRPEDRYQDMGTFAAALERETPGGVPFNANVETNTVQSITNTYATIGQFESKGEEENPVKPVVIAPPVTHPVTQELVSPAPVMGTEPTPATMGRNRAVIFGIIALVAFLVIGIASGWFTRRSTPLTTEVPVLEGTVEPTILPTQPTTPSEGITIGSTMISPIDGMTMVYVSAGEFLMGSPEGAGYDDERPQHTVYLDAYWIDQTEVTNAMYARCVADGGCTEPRSRESYTRDSYYGNPDYDEYPVISVTWHQAEAYCQWAGRELPTEAQWEKAARGTDGRTYPWGNEPPAGNLVNFADKNTDYDWSNKAIDDGYEDSAPVGTYPDGASPYSALDMAGNVLEWVADWYGDYPSGSVSNPTGPTIGESRVLRGGSWNNLVSDIRSAFRSRSVPGDASGINFGFRCSLSASEAP